MKPLPLSPALLAALLSMAPCWARAAPVTLTETATYSMGDSDSRAAARNACLGKARAQALLKMGSLVETRLNTATTEAAGAEAQPVQNAATAQTRALSVGLVRAELQGESASLDPEGHVIETCTLRVTLDPDEVRKATQAAAQDDSRLKAAEARIAKLEDELAARDQQPPPPPSSAPRPASFAPPPPAPTAYFPPPPPGTPAPARYQPPSTVLYVMPPPRQAYAAVLRYPPPRGQWVLSGYGWRYR